MILKPRFTTATGQLPGDHQFWVDQANKSDLFALKTAQGGKGGPFGAQLWVVREGSSPVMIGTDDSNAVVIKGIASAHAEAENLSPENRSRLFSFLEEHRGQGWKVVQVSSGESCQSCRSKQVLTAQELIQKELIKPGDFHVVFKATFERTAADAQFNDLPYDMTYRVINALGVMDREEGLFGLAQALQDSNEGRDLLTRREIVYNPVNKVEAMAVYPAVNDIFSQNQGRPVAVVVSKEGQIMSSAVDERNRPASINLPEKSALILALHRASEQIRKSKVFESWNLQGATLYTNVRDIGPASYGETLWCNLSAIDVVEEYTSAVVEDQAQELPGTANRDLFKMVAAEYNMPPSPLIVRHIGNPEEPSQAHAWWRDHRVNTPSHYDGKQAPTQPVLENQG